MRISCAISSDFYCEFACSVAVIASALNAGDLGSSPRQRTVFSHWKLEILAFVNWENFKPTNPIHIHCAALCILMFWRTSWRKVTLPLCHPCSPEDSNQKLDKGLTCLTNQSPCLLNEPQTCFSSCCMDILWTSSERKEVNFFNSRYSTRFNEIIWKAVALWLQRLS